MLGKVVRVKQKDCKTKQSSLNLRLKHELLLFMHKRINGFSHEASTLTTQTFSFNWFNSLLNFLRQWTVYCAWKSFSIGNLISEHLEWGKPFKYICASNFSSIELKNWFYVDTKLESWEISRRNSQKKLNLLRFIIWVIFRSYLKVLISMKILFN